MREPEVLWSAVDAHVDRARSPADLRAHGLHLLAAARLRALGRPVPEVLIVEERRAAIGTLAVPALLRRARAAYDGPLMVMKGAEVALRYPDPTVRPFWDVDLLAEDAAAAQRAFIAAGFHPLGPPEDDELGHDLRPLAWPGLPIVIDMHREPHWVEGLRPPPRRELFEAAEPSGLGVPGILAPAPYHHALLLAAHGWAHEPLRRLVELVDVATVIHGTDLAAVRTLARQWRCERVWHHTELAVDALLYGAPRPLALRTWARHLHDARERTMLESRLQRLAGPAWGLPVRSVPRAVFRAGAAHVRRHGGEPWRTKVVRTGRIVRNVSLSVSEHDRRLGRTSIEGNG